MIQTRFFIQDDYSDRGRFAVTFFVPSIHIANPEERWESFVRVPVKRYVVHESPSREDANISSLWILQWITSLGVDDNDIVVNVECLSLDVRLGMARVYVEPEVG